MTRKRNPPQSLPISTQKSRGKNDFPRLPYLLIVCLSSLHLHRLLAGIGPGALLAGGSDL